MPALEYQRSDYCEGCGYDGALQLKEDEAANADLGLPDIAGNQNPATFFGGTEAPVALSGTPFWIEGRTQDSRTEYCLWYTYMTICQQSSLVDVAQRCIAGVCRKTMSFLICLILRV